ncbi:anti-sigma factor [Microbacterium halotolerans]|uniref:anti-sigma factor n=1 Tax=Microbacterium halotolerans TaxID=246613 RepID=UPI000E6AB604|nr:anti-sigma factor [Microbacterium halotolerans]
MSEKDLDELLAGRALHSLDPEDAQRLDRALAGDLELRERAERDEETAALLAEATTEVEPPSSIRDALLTRIAEQSAAPSVDSEAGAAQEPDATGSDSHDGERGSARRRRRRRGRRRLWALAASIVVIAGLGGGAIVATQVLERPAAVEALDRIEAAADARSTAEDLPGGGTLDVHWSYETGQAVIVADDVPALEDGSQYELWLVREEAPISAGVFDGGAGEPKLLESELSQGDVIAVTVEDEGGSATGAPTTEPIIAVPTA